MIKQETELEKKIRQKVLAKVIRERQNSRKYIKEVNIEDDYWNADHSDKTRYDFDDEKFTQWLYDYKNKK
jgi:hypothetical protein